MRREGGIDGPRAVGGVARPGIHLRTGDHAGAHRVALYVSVAREGVMRRIDKTGAESPLPQRPGPTMTAIERGDVALAEIAHQRGAACGIAWREQQMDVVCHQAIRV